MKTEELKTLLFSFRGRMNRKPYILISLALIAVIFVIGLVLGLFIPMFSKIDESVLNILILLLGVVSIPFLAVYIWITIATTAKRLHDTDYSAWWMLVNFIPYVGGLILFVWTWFIKGTDGPNRFGENPLEESE